MTVVTTHWLRRIGLFTVYLTATLAGDVQLADQTGTSRPEQFGAGGNAVTDDTIAVQRAADEAAETTGQLVLSGDYRISRGIIINAPMTISGGGQLIASSEIEQNIGVAGTDAMLRITAQAPGARILNTEFDLAGSGRTALRIESAGTNVDGVSVRNYSKSVKADNKRHNKSESGIRVSASDVTIKNVTCERMFTTVEDAVPRCITVHGGAMRVRIDALTGVDINGGVTVGASDGVMVTDFSFRNLSDNGLYLLPDSNHVIATDGEIDGINETVVFKGKDAIVRRLRIHNQEQGLGLENASGVVISDIIVTYDGDLRTRPAFLRTRIGNERSSNIRLENVRASMPLGNAIFNLAHGAVVDFTVVDSEFELDVSAKVASRDAAFLYRQNAGDVPEISGSTFRFMGEASMNLRSVHYKSMSESDEVWTKLKSDNRFLRGDEELDVKPISRTAD
jgi:hypothetical protein